MASSQQSEKLAAFLATLEHANPLVHDEITRSALKKRGWNCKDTKEDIQLQRFVSLAAQRFIASISHDSLQICRHRRDQPAARLKEQGFKDTKAQAPVLMMEDLAEALQEYGVRVKPAPYFVDGLSKQ